MEAMGVPGALLPLVIALELGGGLAILAGAFIRWIAVALAAFSVVAALIFHADFADPMQAISFWKNVAIGGGFLLLAAQGPGSLSVDRSEEHTSELQSLMRLSYAVFCLNQKPTNAHP